MMRADILVDKSLADMTLDELAFRRNGLHHDVRRAALSNRSSESLALAETARGELAEVEGEIRKRLAGKP
jgi:hypothetical protein